eukprot:10915770-Karenia_brevis.AAC.1
MQITALKPPDQQDKILQTALRKKRMELETAQSKRCALSKAISELTVDINGIEGQLGALRGANNGGFADVDGDLKAMHLKQLADASVSLTAKESTIFQALLAK